MVGGRAWASRASFEGRLGSRQRRFNVSRLSLARRTKPATLTKRTQNHQQSLAQARGDLPVIKPAHADILPLRQIQPNLLPRLSERRVVRRVIGGFLTASRESNMRREAVGWAGRATDEEELGCRFGVGDPS